MAVITKKYKHKDLFVEQEFKSLVDQLNRHLQGKLLNVDQIPVGLNAFNIPEDKTSDRALDTEYINDRDLNEGRWIFAVVDLNTLAGINATAGVDIKIGYKTPILSLGNPEIISGQYRRQVTLLAWIPNRYRYIIESSVTNGGIVTLISWVEMSWRY